MKKLVLFIIIIANVLLSLAGCSEILNSEESSFSAVELIQNSELGQQIHHSADSHQHTENTTHKDHCLLHCSDGLFLITAPFSSFPLLLTTQLYKSDAFYFKSRPLDTLKRPPLFI